MIATTNVADPIQNLHLTLPDKLYSCNVASLGFCNSSLTSPFETSYQYCINVTQNITGFAVLITRLGDLPDTELEHCYLCMGGNKTITV